MGEPRLRLALVVSCGLACAWLNVVGRFFGETKWRDDEVRTSCAALDGHMPSEFQPRYGKSVRRSVDKCVALYSSAMGPADQITWEDLRTWQELALHDKLMPEGSRLERHVQWQRENRATFAQRAWRGLFELSSLVTFGLVSAEHILVWDRIATATLSCLLAMLVFSLLARLLLPGPRDARLVTANR